MAQALVHGAKLLQVDGNFDDCLALASKLADRLPGHAWSTRSTRTASRGRRRRRSRSVDALGDAPDVHCLPVGNAGNITAYWKGYGEYAADGIDDPPAGDVRLPGRRRGADRARARRSTQPTTIATAIRIGNPASLDAGARRPRRVRRRDRRGHRPADPRGLPAARAREAVFVEPASAASVAGLLQAAERRHARRPVSASSARSPATASRTRSGRSPARRRRSPIAGGRAAAAAALGLALMARPAFRAAPVRVRVPATSANLGPGFDALGLALALYDDVAAAGRRHRACGSTSRARAPTSVRTRRAAPGRARVRAQLSTCSVASRGAWSWSAPTASRTGAASARRPPRSSPASLAARELVALGGAERLDDDAVLALASQIEGHPDNVAACLLGGLTIAWTESNDGEKPVVDPGPQALRLEPHPDLAPVVFVPESQVVDDEGPRAAARARCRTPTRRPTRPGPRCWSRR